MKLGLVLGILVLPPLGRGLVYHLPINNQIRSSSGQVHPFFSPDSSYPLLYKTALTLERSQLSCDWRRHRHYCRLNHFLTCLRSDQVQEPHRRSSVYISTAGGLANHMSTFAATLAIQHRLGVRGLIDLTAFQILDQVFNNIRGSGLEILEEVVCDPAGLVWESFEGHVRDLDPGALGQGKMLTLWLQGISVAEHVSGVAQLMTPHLRSIRKYFTFRNKILEEARRRLSAVVEDHLNRTDVDRGEVVEVVGVHVRRGDHLQYEERRGWDPLTEKYFIQSMDRYRERLRQPVFLMVTDDPVWVRREMAQSSAYSTGFYNSSQPEASAGLDLASLSLCNQLVLSRGTFGTWASVLSGAVRITPKHSQTADPFLVRNQVPTFDFSQRWLSLEARRELGEVCPECLRRHPAGGSLLPGSDLTRGE